MEDALLSKYDICATPRVIQFISWPHITGYSFKLCGTDNLFLIFDNKKKQKKSWRSNIRRFLVKSLLNLNATLKCKWTHCFLKKCIGNKTCSICLFLIWLCLDWSTYKSTTLRTPLNLLYSSLHTFGSRGPIHGCVGVGFRIGLFIKDVVSKGSPLFRGCVWLRTVEDRGEGI